jgi:hypothetical protein
MDELVIGDKKYLSSKQAAKVTGYAKDYIGQLCREGRVPARLVGRSWYVLESALKDHRFGGEKEKAATSEVGAPTGSVGEVYSRYEADELEVVAPMSEIGAPIESIGEVEKEPEPVETHSIQEAWEAWFDRVAHTAAPTSEVGAPTESVGEDAEGEAVTIRTIKTAREETVAPEYLKAPVAVPIAKRTVREPNRGGGGGIAVFKMVSVLVALFLVGLTVLNIGYFDSYITSRWQDTFLAGVSVYNK